MSEAPRKIQIAIRTRVLCEACRSSEVSNYGQSRGGAVSYYRCASCAKEFKVFVLRVDSSFSVAERLPGLLDGDDLG